MTKVGMTLVILCLWMGMGLLAPGRIVPTVAHALSDDFRDAENNNNDYNQDRGEDSGLPGSLSQFDREEGIVKRSAFGLFGLATKRPHKNEADLIHPPHPDAFMSVRGRKRSAYSRRQPFRPGDDNILNSSPTTSLHFRPWSLHPSAFADS